MGKSNRKPKKASKRGRKTKGTPIPYKERQHKFQSLVAHFSGMINWKDYNIDSVVEGLSKWLHTHNNGQQEQTTMGLKKLLQKFPTEYSQSEENKVTVLDSLVWTDLGLSGNTLDEIVVLLVAGLHFFQRATEGDQEEFQTEYDEFCHSYNLCDLPKELQRVFSFLLVVQHNLAPLHKGSGYKVAGEVIASLVLSKHIYHAHSGQNMPIMYAMFHLMIEHISRHSDNNKTQPKTKTTRIAEQRVKKFTKPPVVDEGKVESDSEVDESRIDDLAHCSFEDTDIDEALKSDLFSGRPSQTLHDRS